MLLKINPQNPEPHLLTQAAQIIRHGGVVAFPTDTSYGLAVNPSDDQAVEKIYRLKGRDYDKPLILLISKTAQLGLLAADYPSWVKDLTDKFWPGPLTLIFPACESLKNLAIGASGKIAIRFPDNKTACALIDLAATPLTATSANPSGYPSPFSAREVAAYFPQGLDLIIDAGESERGLDSTILDVTAHPFRLIRSGAIAPKVLQAAGFIFE